MSLFRRSPRDVTSMGNLAMADVPDTEIRIEHLSVRFPDNKNGTPVTALQDVSLTIGQGEFVSLVGPSGCGKTTLLRTIADLQQPTEGKVTVLGQSPREVRLAKKYGIVFQNPVLYDWRTVRRNVCMPMELKGIPKKIRTQTVSEMLDLVGLYDFGKKFPHELSGGMQQRVGIARALAVNPRLIIADEPISALDVSIQAQVINLLEDLQEQFDLTYLFIAHDLRVVEHISDRVAVMYLGKIVELADSEELYAKPLHPYTEALLSAIPIPDPATKRQRIILEGDPPSPIHPPAGCPFHTRCHKRFQRCDSEVPVLREVAPRHYVACHLY